MNQELLNKIEENRRLLERDRGRQIVDREIASLELEPPTEEPSDEELETKRYEPVNASEVVEIAEAFEEQDGDA